MRDHHDPDQALALQALLYAGGELDEADAIAFEGRLAEDQSAREALAQAVELTQTLEGRQPARPDPRWRGRVRDRLAGPSLWQRVVGKRAYRGHPAVWTGLGAAAAVLLMLTTASPSPAPKLAEQQQPEAPAVPSAEAASMWADLHNTEHMEKAHADENRRKIRVEDRRLAKSDDRRGRLHTAPTVRH